tara:strand:- start:234 stop:470 length:237 start_codon:yes stop_codon:yes gene_type:complete
MKDSKIIGLMNKVQGLANMVKQLIEEVQKNASIAKGTLTAFQLHLGEEKWNKLLEELKDKEKRLAEKPKEKKLDLDVE